MLVRQVHLQTNSKLGSTWNAFQHLFRKQTLFRGIGPPMVNAIIMNTVMFSVFGNIKTLISNEEKLTGSASLAAGLLSGFATALISTPTDYLKIQAQLHGVSEWKVLMQQPSIQSLFRGNLINFGREGVFTMVYLGIYDQLQPRGFLEIAATASFTGGMAWVASYPLDTIKSVIQGSPNIHRRLTIRQAAYQLYNTGGLSAFYRGCAASTGRAILVTSLRMIVYEYATMRIFPSQHA